MRQCKIEVWGNSFRLVYTKPERSKLAALPPDFEEVKCNASDNLDDNGKADRMACNVVRAKGRVREIAACNPWDYFATLTLDAAKVDRFDLNNAVRKLGIFFQNNARDNGGKPVKYLLIPEQHRDGAYHFHGLLCGLAQHQLSENKYGYLDWPAYSRRFGFISLSPVRDLDKVASYITKYVTKSIGATALDSGEHMFYASKGLQRKQQLLALPLPDEAAADYENEWCGISWVKQGGSLAYTLLSEIAARPSDYYAQSALISLLSEKTDSKHI